MRGGVWGGGGCLQVCGWVGGGGGEEEGDKTARFWDLRTSTAITIVPSPSGVFCVCVERKRGGVCVGGGEGWCLQVCG